MYSITNNRQVIHTGSRTFVAMADTNTHRGEVVKRVIRDIGMTITRVAKKMDGGKGISMKSVYNHLENPSLSYEWIVKYGRVLKYDFTKEFPEIMPYLQEMHASSLIEDARTLKDELTAGLLRELDTWKSEAFRLSKELTQCKEDYYKLLLKESK